MIAAHLGVESLDWRPLVLAAVFLVAFVAGIVWLRKRAGWQR